MPELRTRSAGAKVTEKEYAEIEKLAEALGLNVGEWCRQVILAAMNKGETPSVEMLLGEIMALRMIFLNLMAYTVQGRQLTTEKMQELIDRSDRERFGRVDERLKEQAARKKPVRETPGGNGAR